MSDVRITYPGKVDTENFVSQQMQVANVRVRNEDDPQKQEQIVADRKQQITKFLQFCDNQHRLAGRQHSHFRWQQHDVELQYVNNTGQPLVYVDPPVRSLGGAENMVVDTLPIPLRATASLQFVGTGGELSSLSNGHTVSLPGDRAEVKAAIVYLQDFPDGLKDSEETVGDELILEDTMKFVGIAKGYQSVDVAEGDTVNPGGFKKPDEVIEEDFVEFPSPIPIFAFGAKMQLKATNPNEFTDTIPFSPSAGGLDNFTVEQDRDVIIYDEFTVLLIDVYVIYEEGATVHVSTGRIDFGGKDGYATTGDSTIFDSNGDVVPPDNYEALLPPALSAFDPEDGGFMAVLPDPEDSFQHSYNARLTAQGRSVPSLIDPISFPDLVPTVADAGEWGPEVELTVDSSDDIIIGGPGVNDGEPANAAGFAKLEFSSVPGVKNAEFYGLDGWSLKVEIPHPVDGFARDFGFDRWGTSLL